MVEECFCCFISVGLEDANPIEATWTFPDGLRMETQDLVVCTACRRLDCDVLTPGGCKRPEAKARVVNVTSGVAQDGLRGHELGRAPRHSNNP